MPRVPFERAFDLTGVYKANVGPKAIEVPPLSFGRFLGLLGADFGSIGAGIAAGMPKDAKPEEPPTDVKAFHAFIARQLLAFDHRAVADVVASVVPGLTADEWREHGSALIFMGLVKHFHDSHDWAFVADAINWGKPRTASEEPTTQSTLAGALLAMTRVTDYRADELLSMRVEGLFYLKAGAMETMRNPDEDDGVTTAEEIAGGVIKDPDRKSSIWASMDAADGKVQ